MQLPYGWYVYLDFTEVSVQDTECLFTSTFFLWCYSHNVHQYFL